jgi:hypothetical protein
MPEITKRIGYLKEHDLNFLRDYFCSEIVSSRKQLEDLNDVASLLSLSKKVCYLQYYLNDMTVFGYPDVTEVIENALNNQFGSKNVLKLLQQKSYAKAISQLSGQKRIGENEYIVEEGVTYHRTLAGSWYVVSAEHVFLLLPKLTERVDQEKAEYFERQYQKTPIDHIYEAWQSRSYSFNMVTLPPKPISMRRLSRLKLSWIIPSLFRASLSFMPKTNT